MITMINESAAIGLFKSNFLWTVDLWIWIVLLLKRNVSLSNQASRISIENPKHPLGFLLTAYSQCMTWPNAGGPGHQYIVIWYLFWSRECGGIGYGIYKIEQHVVAKKMFDAIERFYQSHASIIIVGLNWFNWM